MENELEFTEVELLQFMTDARKDKIEQVGHELIRCLRYSQQVYLNTEGDVPSGFEYLNEWHSQGLISTSNYLKIYELIRDPDLPFEIKVI